MGKNQAKTLIVTLAAGELLLPGFSRAQSFVIESAPGSANNDRYAEVTGTWTNGKEKSRANQLGALVVARSLQLVGGVAAGSVEFRPEFVRGGTWEAEFTWPEESNANNITLIVTGPGINEQKRIDLAPSGANNWNSVGTYTVPDKGELTFRFTTTVDTVAADPSRPIAVFMDGMRFRRRADRAASTVDPNASPFDQPGATTQAVSQDSPFDSIDRPAATAQPVSQDSPFDAIDNPTAAAPSAGSVDPNDPFGSAKPPVSAPAVAALPEDSPFAEDSPFSDAPAAPGEGPTAEALNPFADGSAVTIAATRENPDSTAAVSPTIEAVPQASRSPYAEGTRSELGNFASSGTERPKVRLFDDYGGPAKAQPTGNSGPAIDWLANLESAKEQAKVSNSPVVIVFASDSKLTERFDRQILGDSAVRTALTPYVKLRIDPDKDRDTAAKYNVTRSPYVVILDHFGYTKAHIGAFPDARRFAQELKTNAN